MSAAIDRRRFLGTAVLTAAAAEFFTIGSADAHSRERDAVDATAPVHPLAAFGALKQIDAGVLNVGYAEAGPAMARLSFSCTAGRTTFTASSMSRRCWRPRATGSSCRISAGMARRVSCRRTPSGMRSRRWSRSTSSR